jgi:hypothetical protein
LREYYTHSVRFAGQLTSLPVATNSISLDPANPDRHGRPGLCLTYQDHPDDKKTSIGFRSARASSWKLPAP